MCSDTNPLKRMYTNLVYKIDNFTCTIFFNGGGYQRSTCFTDEDYFYLLSVLKRLEPKNCSK